MKRIRPRRYQSEALNALDRVRQLGQKIALVVMASGLGKTITAALDVKRFLKKTSNVSRILYLCHQNNILEQAQQEFAKVFGEKYRMGFYNGLTKDEINKMDFIFASFQTMRENLEKFSQNEFDYIVIDESHHSTAETYENVIEYFQPHFKLGLTATPDRADVNDIRHIYGEEVYSLPLADALARNLLTKVEYKLITDELVDKKVLNTPIGKLSIHALNRQFFLKKRDKEIVRILLRYLDEAGSRAMIFCNSIEYAERIAKLIPNSYAVHSSLSNNEQRARLERFRSGAVNIVTTVDKFNEGIDVPDVNVIVFLRATSSSTVFYQQLGRGLRKLPGKNKVLVLDFAANCERLLMVRDLRNTIDKVQQKDSKSSSANTAKPVDIDFGKFEFTEVTENIIGILEKISEKYSPEVMIEQLQQLARELGKTPCQAEVEDSNSCASPSTYRKYFGSYNAALQAAGLELNRTMDYSDEELLDQLRALAKKLGKTPTLKDVNDASSCPSAAYLCIRFETYNVALQAAGLELNRTMDYSDEDLLDQLRALTKELGRTPRTRDVNVASNCASSGVFRKRFGSFNAALQAAGLDLNPTAKYSDDELLDQLRVLTIELGRTPLIKDVNKSNKCASATTFNVRFASLSNALKIAGLDHNRATKYSDDELLDQLRVLAKKLGKTPCMKEVERSSSCASSSTFSQCFGSFSAALRAAGFEVKRTFVYCNDEELLDQLRALAKKLGRTPKTRDADAAINCSSSPYLRIRFGSYNAALQAAGLELNRTFYSDEDLLDQLRALTKELGRTPRIRDVNVASNCASSGVFRKRFGSFTAALEAAGLK